MISVTASVSVVTLGGIIGVRIAPTAGLATLPLSFTIIGTALCTVPAALFMQSYGRRTGFVGAAIVGSLALLLAAWATAGGHFYLFCVATALLGVNLAFVQQYRFAAAESVASDRVSIAVSIVLFGSIGGAFLGPRLISWTETLPIAQPFALSLTIVAGLLFLAAMILLLVYRNNSAPAAAERSQEGRPLTTLILQPGFIVAVLAGVCSYGVMTLIMTATPLNMHVIDGHSLGDTGWVITSHVVAMYAPSLFSGPLIVRFGARRIMLAGVLLLAASVLFGLRGREVLHYWQALVALGVGWNFLYVGGTTLLTRQYRQQERFKAQAFNDFCVFGAAGLASLASGSVIHYFGWRILMFIPLPLLVLVALGLISLRDRRPAQSAG